MRLRNLAIGLILLAAVIGLLATVIIAGFLGGSDHSGHTVAASPTLEDKPRNNDITTPPKVDVAPPPVLTTPADNSAGLAIAVILLSLATVVSVSITFYLYRWRRILLSNPHMLVPEELGGHLQHLGNHVGHLHKNLGHALKQLQAQGDATVKNSAELLESFMTLQKTLDERDAEIRRLRKGYDAEVYRKFVTRFLRVAATLDDMKSLGDLERSDIEQVTRLLDDAFAECGVESFAPELGADYRTEHGVADNPLTVRAEREDDQFKIAEVIETGYRIRAGENYEILRPAKVRIFAT